MPERAVGNESSPAPPSRLSSLVDGFTSSLISRFSSLWGSPQPLTSQQSTTAIKNPGIFSQPTQLPGPIANISVPQLPFRHRATKASTSNTSVISQPVLVRTHTRIDRHRPIPASVFPTSSPQSMTATANFPSTDAFSFDGILLSIEPEIRDAIDGIAEIYARSKLSLADEYDAHLPPQGQIAPPRSRYSGLAIRTAGLERTLTTVTEASSSSERLAGGSRAASVASGKGKTAYGSLRSIISRGRSSSHSSAPPETPVRPQQAPPVWTIAGEHERFITLKRQNTAPIHLSLASVAEIPRDKSVPGSAQAAVTERPALATSRSTSWLGWSRLRTTDVEQRSGRRLDAEGALKNVLQNAGHQANDVRL